MIDALHSFIAVATASSFSQVARKQAIAVSSVTRKIDWLEAEIGTRLFHRSSRRVMLTDAGEQFLPRARHILAELAQAKEALASINADPRGLLTVTAPTIFGRRHLAPAVASFLERYPMIEVDLHVSDTLVDLAEQRVDVAIRIGTLPDSALLATRLATLDLVVCASPAYLERHGRPAGLQDLVDYNCITVATPAAAGPAWRFAGVNRGDALALRGSLRTDDKDCALQAALAGIGIAHLASFVASEDIVAGRLVSLFPDARPPDPRALPAIYALRMPGRSFEAKARLFIAHLRDVIGQTPYWDAALTTMSAPRTPTPVASVAKKRAKARVSS
ncbi:MAG: LysR substrate-binding domain-containing protein [Betaproteobacteria bacterium]